jgi:CDP-6-deoxy-D-xylo-4-hexulose-3-dehydrase
MKKDRDGFDQSDEVMKKGMLIACHHGLTKEMINHIIATFEKFVDTKV